MHYRLPYHSLPPYTNNCSSDFISTSCVMVFLIARTGVMRPCAEKRQKYWLGESIYTISHFHFRYYTFLKLNTFQLTLRKLKTALSAILVDGRVRGLFGWFRWDRWEMGEVREWSHSSVQGGWPSLLWGVQVKEKENYLSLSSFLSLSLVKVTISLGTPSWQMEEWWVYWTLWFMRWCRSYRPRMWTVRSCPKLLRLWR